MDWKGRNCRCFPHHAVLARIEVSGDSQPDISPAGAASVERWRELGVKVGTAAVTGLPFWSTVEIEECPQLAVATRDLLERLA